MTDCIVSPYWKNSKGYAKRRYQGVMTYAHRAAYCEANGCSLESISGYVVRHACDNPPCVNPEHLELGSQADNVQDMMSRGRRTYAKGEKALRSMVSQEVAEAIRTEYRPRSCDANQTVLAEKYGIDQTTVSRIIRGLTY